MTAAVLEVGPVTVRGPGTVSAELAETAVDCIDDAIALIDDQPIAVDELWAEVIGAAAGPQADTLTLVFPSWWTADQIARVRAVCAGDDVVLHRAQALSADRTETPWAVVEIAAELVMVSCRDTDPVALARHHDDDTLAHAVAAAADGACDVIIDAPAEVTGAVAFGRVVAGRLRDRGAHVTFADPATLRRGIIPPRTEPDAENSAGRARFAAVVALVGAVLCAAIAVGSRDRPPVPEPMAVLVEGRVGMQVPVGWTVQRVTTGSGSARVQVVSPSDPDVAVHLTQSPVAEGPVAETLRRALDEQPAGVFADFNPADRIADRPVISYTELRPERHVRWAVLVDGPVRIAVGCQSAPGRADLVRQACDAAIRSAHAVF